jgi:hypothetical protein
LLNRGAYFEGMQIAPQPLRFGHHALAVLSATMVGSTVFALISTVAIAILARVPIPVSLLASVTLACWFLVFFFSLPGAAILFSLLWPSTRRGTPAGAWICVIAGATLGVVLAPFGAKHPGGATLMQIALLGLTGAMIGALYVLFARRMARSSNPRRFVPARGFRHSLPPVTPEAAV